MKRSQKWSVRPRRCCALSAASLHWRSAAVCGFHACRDHILQDDLAQFGLSEKHAAEAFAMLDEDGDGHATLQVSAKLFVCLMLCKFVKTAAFMHA